MRSNLFKCAGLILLLLLFPFHLIFSQEEKPPAPVSIYSLGQQSLSISAGLFVPLFFMSFDGTLSDSTNLYLGGSGSLQWGVHLDNHWLVGVEVAGMFSPSVQKNILYMLPITVKGAYSFHVFPFEFPVFLGMGLDIVKYRDQTHLNFILKPGFSSIWKYNVSWGFGLNAVYWWVPQPWSADPQKARMGNFLDITLMAQYNF